MKVFQAHDNPLNTSHWIGLYHHQITAAGAPGQQKLARWRESEVTDLVTLLREDEMATWLPQTCADLGLGWHHFPLSGKRLLAASDMVSLEDLALWSRSLAHQATAKHIVLHCAAGLHRTGVGLYLMLRAAGSSPEEALAHIQQARPLTEHELTRRTRRHGRLADIAEQKFEALSLGQTSG